MAVHFLPFKPIYLRFPTAETIVKNITESAHYNTLRLLLHLRLSDEAVRNSRAIIKALQDISSFGAHAKHATQRTII